jgi:ERCC4-related helicase
LIDKVENNLKNQLQKIILDKLQTLKKGAISTPKENIKKGAISTIYKGGICNLNTNNNDEVKNNVCKITGLDISMQKESGLLSHTGLKHYYENDKKIFEQIKLLYLSKQWQKSDFQKQIKEIAHNIRNTISNQKIKQERLYQPKQLNILNTLGI